MTRRRGRPGAAPPARHARATAPAPGRGLPRAGRVGIALIAALALAAGTMLVLRSRSQHAPARVDADAALPVAARAESVRAALRRQDWDRAQKLIGPLLQSNPRDPTLLLASALAWHNAAWLGGRVARVRTATRTTLDRIEMEHRALALMDSAAACARSPGEWNRIHVRIAQVYENLGLYVDAREVYRQIEARDSAFAEARLRDAAIVALLRAPAR